MHEAQTTYGTGGTSRQRWHRCRLVHELARPDSRISRAVCDAAKDTIPLVLGSTSACKTRPQPEYKNPVNDAGIDIATFGILRDRLATTHGPAPPAGLLMAAGMLSSTTAQLVAYPLGLVRTRLQVRKQAIQQGQQGVCAAGHDRAFRASAPASAGLRPAIWFLGCSARWTVMRG